MIRTLLENNFVPAASLSQTAEEMRKEFQKRQFELAEKYKGIVDDKLLFENSLSATGEDGEDLDFTHEDVIAQRHTFNSQLDEARDEVQKFNNELSAFKRYGNDFAYLQRIKEIEDCASEGAELQLVEIAKDYERGTGTDDSYFADLAGGERAEKNLALRVVMDNVPPFYLSLQQHDNTVNGKREPQLKISIDDEDLLKLGKENLQKILAFCESHGFSTLSADFPFSLDGLDSEDKFKSLFAELQHEAQKREEVARLERDKQDSDLFSHEVYENALSTENQEKAELPQTEEFSPADKLYGSFVTSTEGRDGFLHNMVERMKKPFVKNHTQGGENKANKSQREKIEENLEKKMFEEGLAKERNLSYFKGRAGTGIFGSAWTVYTVFSAPDKNNMAENGRCDKNGKPKYTYDYKLYVNQDSQGNLHFAYHMRDNKKVNEDMVNALVGQLKDAGITQVRFPKGVPDSDKKIWRIALAEKGIIPVNMSLDKAKAQGMLEAAKKKLSDEEYAKFKFNLGKQMKKHAEAKGKKLDTSEEEYIESLLSSHYYDPFVHAYNAVIKGGLSRELRKAGKDSKMGAAKKIGAYYAVSRLFAVYDSTVKKATIANSPELSEEEVRRIKMAGLDIEPHKLSKEQMAELYELLLPRCVKEADKECEEAFFEAKDVGNMLSKGAKRADNVILKEIFDAARNGFEDVNECLKNNGCDEISMPKVMGRLQYLIFYDRHPEFLRKNNANANTNANTPPAPTRAPNTNGNGGRNP